MREDVRYDDGMCAVSGEYEGQARRYWKKEDRGVSCDWLRFSDLWGTFVTSDMVYTTVTTFSHVVTCSDIVRGRYKSIHHQGASCELVGPQERTKWPKV
jgi:hypothetical protein